MAVAAAQHLIFESPSRLVSAAGFHPNTAAAGGVGGRRNTNRPRLLWRRSDEDGGGGGREYGYSDGIVHGVGELGRWGKVVMVLCTGSEG